jgi:hypothetical protein
VNFVLRRRADSRRRNAASPPVLLPITKVEIDWSNLAWPWDWKEEPQHSEHDGGRYQPHNGQEERLFPVINPAFPYHRPTAQRTIHLDIPPSLLKYTGLKLLSAIPTMFLTD